MYKAVFLDLDGTLLDDKKEISNENKEAIKYVIQNGGKVYLASGRPIDAIKKYWNIVNASNYIIYSNGAGIFDMDTNETIFSANILKNTVLEIFNSAIEKNLCVRLDTPYGRFITNPNYGLSMDVFLSEDIITFLNDNNILQISIISESKENVHEFIDYINNSNFREIKIEDMFITGKSNELHAVNLINTNASKGNAISGLCKFLKIDLNDVIAIGDGINDISMIKTVGLGVAMKNADEELKIHAKQITETNNNNGVSLVLKNSF